MGAAGGALSSATKSPTETEIQILSSRAVAGRVVDSLRLQALVLRFLQYLIGFALNDNAAPIHEHDDITDFASKRHFMGHDDHRHTVVGELSHDAQHFTHQLGIKG